MAKKSGLVKFTIIFILAFFILVTWLSMIVPYIGGNKNTTDTGDISSGTTIPSGTDTVSIESGLDTSGAESGASALPPLTTDEATKTMQQYLSWTK